MLNKNLIHGTNKCYCIDIVSIKKLNFSFVCIINSIIKFNKRKLIEL